MVPGFAADREVRVMYFNGAGYVVRSLGASVLAGIRQGTGSSGGFVTRRFARGDVCSPDRVSAADEALQAAWDSRHGS